MIDLHIHTYCSDGADAPSTVMRKVRETGLTTVSLTDHNSVAAYEAIVPDETVRIIPGVEITCMNDGEVVEVLGYCFDIDAMKQELSLHTLTFEEKQKKEFLLIEAAYRRAGVKFDSARIVFDPKKESCRKAFLNELRRYPENRCFFKNDETWSVSRAFARQEVYNPKSRLYVDEASLYPTVREAVDMVHRCGGMAFLAHMYEYAQCEKLRGYLESFCAETGLDGLECAHSSFTPEQIQDLEAFCDAHGFMKSGGSDYHGARKPGIELGTGRGQLHIKEDYLASWKKMTYLQA